MALPGDYEAAAVVLDDAAARTRALLGPARSVLGEGVLVGGALTDAVTAELDAADRILLRVTGELTALAETCRQRAGTARAVVPLA
jgi:hypothetical protein